MFRTNRQRREFETVAVVIMAVALLCTAFFSTFADAQINAGRRLALVVGNTAYENVTPLKNAVRDADAVSATLKQLGFEVVLLKDAKASEIEAAVAKIKSQASDAEATLFYYSGHGFQMRGANFLVPVDAVMRDRSKIDKETLRLDSIIASLQSKGRQTLVFLDACRNDPLPVSIRNQTSGQGLAQVQTGKGTFVAFATQPGNVTADGAGDRSPFTNAFVEHVGTPGISISDMMIRIRNTVEENTLQRQTPWDQSSLRSQFYFNPSEDEQEELSEETLELLASLDPALRKKFAERFGIELPDEDEFQEPEEAAGPRLSIAPVTEKPVTETTESEIASNEEPEEQRALAPRLGLSPAAGRPDAADSDDLGTSGTVEIAQPNFRPSPQEPASQEEEAIVEEQEVAILLPSDRRPVRSTSRTSASVLVPRQGDPSSNVRETATSPSNRIRSSTPNGVNRAASPQDSVQSLPVPDGGDRASSGETEISALSPLNGGAVINSANSVTRSLPSVDRTGTSAQSATGQIVLQPLTSSLATRIVGQDVTPAPKEVEKEPVQLAALNPQDVKPASVPLAVPANLPLAVQEQLYRLGCYRSSRDGIWGKKSENALIRYYLQKKESPDLIDPEAELYAKLSAEEKVVCERTEQVRPTRKKKPASRTARLRPSSKKAVKKRTTPRATKRRVTRKKASSRPRKARAPAKRTAKRSGGGAKRIKKIKKLGGAFR